MGVEINPNLYPPSGYEFTETDSSVHRAGSWGALIKKVREYRTLKGVEVGDVRAEIMAQVCGRFPDYCGDYKSHTRTPKAHPSGMAFNQRVLQWLGGALAKFRRGEWPAKVSLQEAAQRAAICATCPARQSLNKGCASCMASVKRGRKVLLGTEEPMFKDLKPCGILGEDTAVTVETDLPRVNNGNLPAHCWRKA